MTKTMDELCVNTIRALAMDAVREQLLPDAVTERVSVEGGATLGWARYVGRHGHSIGMDTFRASAPLKELQKKFGFVPENFIDAARARIPRARR